MLYTSDWESLSANVVAQNAALGKTYDEFDWFNLPENIKEAAIELGYNQRIWEGDAGEPESNSKSWRQLTNKERKAALVLGYTEETWDGADEEPEEEYREEEDSWVKLSTEARNAAKILGYTQAIWDNDGSPPTEDLDWDQLSRREQEAAKALGYTKEKWDGDDDDNDSFQYPIGPARTRSSTRSSSPDYGGTNPDSAHSSGGSVLDQIKSYFI